jgi:divalent metal cation (Fe/Co/Zn/Cd) transporter
MTTIEAKLYQRAYLFAAFVCVYNVAEGLAAVALGLADESLTLFGFGVDSFIEVASNVGVLYMIKRIRQNPGTNRTEFESTALKITGYGFYLLSATLAIGIVLSLYNGRQPHDTLWGIVISCISILVMYYVATQQIKTGTALQSQAIISDAKCTMICIYMSVVLLLSSFIYKYTGFAYADAIGATGIIYFSVMEGKEALEKARGGACCHH